MEHEPDDYEWAILQALDDFLQTERVQRELVTRQLTTQTGTKRPPQWGQVKSAARPYIKKKRDHPPLDQDWNAARDALAFYNIIKLSDAKSPTDDTYVLLTARGDQYIADVLRSRGPIGIAEDRRNERMWNQMRWRTGVAVSALFVSIIALYIAAHTAGLVNWP